MSNLFQHVHARRNARGNPRAIIIPLRLARAEIEARPRIEARVLFNRPSPRNESRLIK